MGRKIPAADPDINEQIRSKAQFGDTGTLVLNSSKGEPLEYKWLRHIGVNDGNMISDLTPFVTAGQLIMAVYPANNRNVMGYGILQALTRPTQPSQAVWVQGKRRAHDVMTLWAEVRDKAAELKHPPETVMLIGSIGYPVLLATADQPQKGIQKVIANYLDDPRLDISSKAQGMLTFVIPDKLANRPSFHYPELTPPEDFDPDPTARDAYCVALEATWYKISAEGQPRMRRYAPLVRDKFEPSSDPE